MSAAMHTQSLIRNILKCFKKKSYKNFLIICRGVHDPTYPFTVSELQNPSYDDPELHKIRRSPAIKLRKGRSGSVNPTITAQPKKGLWVGLYIFFGVIVISK